MSKYQNEDWYQEWLAARNRPENRYHYDFYLGQYRIYDHHIYLRTVDTEEEAQQLIDDFIYADYQYSQY